MKIKVWNVTGYKGRDNYDGPSDDNTDFHVAMDARFTKDDVVDIFLNRFGKKHRMVALNAKLVAEYDVPSLHQEEEMEG